MNRKVPIGNDGDFAICRDTTDKRDTSLTLFFDLEDDTSQSFPTRNSKAISANESKRKQRDESNRSYSSLLSSVKSYFPFQRNGDVKAKNLRPSLAVYRNAEINKNFRISKNPTQQKAERIEVFFYNHGMELALAVLFLAINILAAAHGAYQFTEAGGWTTDDAILRVTLPIARAGGRLVTVNCAILLLTTCKYLWTSVRTYLVPILPIGFPIDNIMPKYHRVVALTVIVGGCVVHTLPQIVNYAARSITFDHDGIRMWTFGDGFATKQLLITGTLLTIIFSTFFMTTLKAFRKTAAGFRWFWAFHMGGIAAAYPLLLIHGTCRGYPIFLYVGFVPLALYMFDVFMRRSKISKTRVVEWKVHDDAGQQITELTVECPRNFSYTPGQYAELKFPPISSTEWHPFTIASAPDPAEINCIDSGKSADLNDSRSPDKKKSIVFYIKNSGRWTESLYNFASAFDLSKSTKPMEVFIRGPHGAPAMNYFEYKHIVVIGSGVGVTPLLSIWKYLVARGMETCIPDSLRTSSTTNIIEEREVSFQNFQDSMLSFQSEFYESNLCNLDTLSILEDDGETRPIRKGARLRTISLMIQEVLETLTISMTLLIFFVLGETITIVCQMFGYSIAANILGSALSSFALIVHGMTIIASTVSMGFSCYFRTFKCWIECGIVVLDTIALGLSLANLTSVSRKEYAGGISSNEMFFFFFGMVVALHAIRIFHIFYVALNPSFTGADDAEARIEKRQSIVLDTSRRLTSTKKSKVSNIGQEICSVEGILINRKFSSMHFAARTLLPSLLESSTLSKIFSMTFYGTRESPPARKERCEETSKRDDVGSPGFESNNTSTDFLAEMMGSATSGLDLETHVCKEVGENCFQAGRPDWNHIFLRALAKAHTSHEEGESVGVFFCGSPAIARDLQAAASRVTAQHQFAIKCMEGRPCKCKVIVHAENF